MANAYHVPVMLKECIEGLNIKPEGVYVDVTFGGGGHSAAILKKLGPEGRLYAFDQDPDAELNAPAGDGRFHFIAQNFEFIKTSLRYYNVRQVDGILADLGISSYQIDAAERGFSTRYNAPLDMRMDKSRKQTAADILNTYSVAQLQDIFSRYGEVRNAKTLAMRIAEARAGVPFSDIEDFKTRIDNCVPAGKQNKYLAQVFQSLRIEVNEEMRVLERLLEQSEILLAPGGRLVVMSYHSLEDRLVKNFMQSGNVRGELEKDFYGNITRPFKLINRKPIEAGADEIAENNRARSAKLRVAEKQEAGK